MSHTYILASERSERDTIRGVQIRAGPVYVIVIPWVLGVYQNKMPVSRGRSQRVKAFCSDIPRSNHGITILYPKFSSHCISLYKILTKMVTIIVNIVTKLDRNKCTYSC